MWVVLCGVLMSRSSGWLRVDAPIFTDPELEEGGWWVGVTWLIFLTWVKLRGYRGGVVPKADISARALLKHSNGYAERHASHRDMIERKLATALDSILASELVTDEEDSVRVAQWSRYQSDPTAAARKRRERKSQ